MKNVKAYKRSGSSALASLGACATAGLLSLTLATTTIPAQAQPQTQPQPQTQVQDQSQSHEINLQAAAAMPDVMLGVFTNSSNDCTDTFYMSLDGVHFEQISEAFKDLTPNGPDILAYGSGTSANPFPGESTWHPGMMNGNREYGLCCFNSPSLIYHNGYFWMLANESNGGDDGTLRLVISFSKDLEHWSDQRQWKVDVPALTNNQGNGEGTRFDAVAADWAVAPDGNVYVAVSLGYYGDFHGRPEQDAMYPYMVKITELSTQHDPVQDPRLNWEAYVNFQAEPAMPIYLAGDTSANRIDGSFFFEGSSAYYMIKRDGIYDEIWSVGNLGNLNNPFAWRCIQANMHQGAEAPSLTKLNGNYYFFTDAISTYPAFYGNNGTYMTTSKSLGGGWSANERIQAYTANKQNKTYIAGNQSGPRHGTVITVTDPAAKQVIYNARAKAGWTKDTLNAPYSDIAWNEWYADEGWITKMTESGLMGVADGARGFRPNDNTSRAMVVTILYRAYTGNTGNAPDTATSFNDVNGHWAKGNIEWAASVGLASRNPNFNPDVPVTREELAAFMARFAQLKQTGSINGVPAASDAAYNRCSDTGNVSEYAVPAVVWCVDKGVMGANGAIDPHGFATRAVAAKMISQTLSAV